MLQRQLVVAGAQHPPEAVPDLGPSGDELLALQPEDVLRLALNIVDGWSLHVPVRLMLGADLVHKRDA